MRVLHLTPELPYETGAGGRGHELFVCRRLVELGHQVLNISPVLPGEAHLAQELRDVGVDNWIVRRPASHFREAVGAVIAEPAVLATAVVAPVRALEMRIFWIRMRRLVEQAIRDWQPDVVVVVHGMAAAWAKSLPSTIPVVLELHDLHWHWYLSRARRRRGVPAILLKAEAERHRRYLLGLLPRYRSAIALSTIEAYELRAIANLPVSVIPIGVDTRALRPVAEHEGPPRLLFTGSFGYQPNSQGVRWFADRVWPDILRRVPSAHLDVVGRDPPPAVQALAHHDGISVVGPVPSMAPYFARAHVVVAPILTGAGIRVKIVEAMAAGRAIVTTSLGCGGMPYLEPDRHLLLANEPYEFATAVIRLLEDRALRRAVAGEARLLAERRYDWHGIGDDYERVLTDAVDQSASPAGSDGSHAVD
jgi:glycosyltransferase involved in cell wall biosynthesis